MTFADYLAAVALLYLAAVAWPLAVTDIRLHRLPNKYVVPSFGVTAIAQGAAVLIGAPWQQMLAAFCIALTVFVLGLAANRWAGLGMGDVKLLAAIAWALGWWGSGPVICALLAGLGIATVFSLVRMLFQRADLRQAIALGPYLLSGFLLSATAFCTSS